MIAAFAASVLGSREGRAAVAVIALAAGAILAFALWDRSIRAEERARIAAEQATTIRIDSMAMQGRLDAVVTDARLASEALAQAQAANETLLQEIAHASAANDDRACLDAGSVQRLQRLR